MTFCKTVRWLYRQEFWNSTPACDRRRLTRRVSTICCSAAFMRKRIFPFSTLRAPAGLTVRNALAHLVGLYGLKVSPDLISCVTDRLRVKIRDVDSRTVKNQMVCVALGVTCEGRARCWSFGLPRMKAPNSGFWS